MTNPTQSPRLRNSRKDRLLLTLFSLSIIDWMFTLYLIDHGGTEVNPLNARLLEISPLAVLGFKLVIFVPAVLVFSENWNRAFVQRAVVALVWLYTVLIVYELGLALINLVGGWHV